MESIVGRDAECEEIEGFIADARRGPSFLSIEGEAGMGKSALRRYAAELARSAGALVLATTPGEGEAPLAFVGLTDLLAPIDSACLDVLPGPQRAALDSATLRMPSNREPPDQRAIGTALVTLLEHLAAERPVIVQIDDVQWLDAPSRAAIQFAVRRVVGSVGVMTCRRVPDEGPDPRDWIGSLARQRCVRLVGLSLGATFVLIRDQLGIVLTRLRLARVWEASRGNPLLSLELVRAGNDLLVDRRPDEVLLTDRLLRLLVARVGALSSAGFETSLGAACAGRLTIGALRSLDLEHGLADAEEAGVLAVVGDRVEFTHPLLASAALAAASAARRREMHRALATVASSADSRARHLALADPAPHPEVAGALEEAADEASRRGAISTAIELAQLSVERTADPRSEDMWRRRAALATHLYGAGESHAAADALDGRDTLCPPGTRRAAVELVMVEVAFQALTVAEAALAARTALEHADDPTTRARALLSLDVVEQSSRDPGRVTAALDCLAGVEQPDRPTLAWALIAELYRRQRAGDPVDPNEIDRVVALEREGRVWRSTDNAAGNRPVLLAWIDQPAAALVALDELEARSADEGNEGSVPYFLGHRASCLIALARLDDAAEAALRHLLHAEATAQHGQLLQARYLLATVDILRDPVAALSSVRALLEQATAAEDQWMASRIRSLVGIAELANGNAAEARRNFDDWHDATRREGERGPAVRRCYVDYVEALLADGDRVAAAELADWLLAAARRSERTVQEAAALHGHALVAADSGDLDQALAHIDHALSFGPAALNDLDYARASMTRGLLLRRLRRKNAAKDALEAARTLFADAGAMHWVGIVERELERLGRRTVGRFELTVTERRVAELAAQGHTNREVGEMLFISSKTVEANLGRVYRKLGIRSRAELGARMTAELSDEQSAS